LGQIAGAFQNLSNHFKIAGNPNSVIFDNPGGKEFAADIAGAKDYRVLHPRTKQEVVPTLLDGRQIPYTPTNLDSAQEVFFNRDCEKIAECVADMRRVSATPEESVA